MGGKPKPTKKKKRLYAKPVFPKSWPRDENGELLFSALWPKDENGEFRTVAVTDTGWSAEGEGASLGPRQIQKAKEDFTEDFGSIVFELDFEFTEVDE